MDSFKNLMEAMDPPLKIIYKHIFRKLHIYFQRVHRSPYKYGVHEPQNKKKN